MRAKVLAAILICTTAMAINLRYNFISDIFPTEHEVSGITSIAVDEISNKLKELESVIGRCIVLDVSKDKDNEYNIKAVETIEKPQYSTNGFAGQPITRIDNADGLLIAYHLKGSQEIIKELQHNDTVVYLGKITEIKSERITRPIATKYFGCKTIFTKGFCLDITVDVASIGKYSDKVKSKDIEKLQKKITALSKKRNKTKNEMRKEKYLSEIKEIRAQINNMKLLECLDIETKYKE